MRPSTGARSGPPRGRLIGPQRLPGRARTGVRSTWPNLTDNDYGRPASENISPRGRRTNYTLKRRRGRTSLLLLRRAGLRHDGDEELFLVLPLAHVVLGRHRKELVTGALVGDLVELRRLDRQRDPALLVTLLVHCHFDHLAVHQGELLRLPKVQALDRRPGQLEPGQVGVLLLDLLGEFLELRVNFFVLFADENGQHLHLDLLGRNGAIRERQECDRKCETKGKAKPGHGGHGARGAQIIGASRDNGSDGTSGNRPAMSDPTP